MFRAEKLITGLGEEAVRWENKVYALGEDNINLCGNIILASAMISFGGPFNV